MDKSKAKLERVRPILQAMERSIDAARRRRTADNEPLGEDPVATTPAETPAPPRVEPGSGPVDAETATRMRARPKRPRGFDEVTRG
jgi:hypothetical protein